VYWSLPGGKGYDPAVSPVAPHEILFPSMTKYI
jgi:hypothetical protein